MAKPKSKKAQLASLEARLEVLTGRGTDEMRASLQAQIDALEAKPKAPVGHIGEQGPEEIDLPAGTQVSKEPS